ncbi:MAG: DUF882 domain-containing protein [Polyangiaceae bacterium]|jgi:hypothetical protein|nr:DUF882 domain-containing protein [Polyangiaceae bacterium]MBK8939415.1 DUF882 domain-containing protein [Polyangiaceae bacterium]
MSPAAEAPRRRSPPRRRRVAVATALALAFAAGGPASAQMLLEQPPREIEFRLDRPRTTHAIDLLQPLRDAGNDRLGPVRLYTSGPYGRWVREPAHALSWAPTAAIDAQASILSPPAARDAWLASEIFDLGSDDHASLGPELSLLSQRAFMSRYDFGISPAFDSTGFGLTTDGFAGVFRLPPLKPVVDWRCRRKPVQIMRSGGESDRFDLVRCDGSVAPEALDRLSILARPPEVARPGDLLPDEPAPDAWSARREWTAGVRMTHPRLVWALQQLADAFPRKPIILYSGYRPSAEVNDGSGHKSLHADGRALDITVHRVDNEELFRACTKLKGIGCGFYPKHRFVHIDVRRAGPGESFFIDGSEPGEPAKYLSDYPGLVQGGKLVRPAKP